MRWAIVALAVFTAGCAALPPEVRIRFPDWMRGQGFNREQQQPATRTETTAPPVAPAQTSSAWTHPTGEFSAVYTAFTAQVEQRYAPGMSQTAIVSDVQAQGYRCAPDNQNQQVCERLQPIGGGCDDVFVVTARPAGGAVGDVRRRCPIGQSPPQPGPSNLLGAPLG